jgi:hypothetical protein
MEVVARLTAEHAHEAALLYDLWAEEPDDALHGRISAHLDGLLVGATHGADPFATLEQPWNDGELFVAAWLIRALGRVDLAPLLPASAESRARADADGWR